MTAHEITTTADTAIDVFSRDRRPVLTVAPGDSVTAHTLDASGYLAKPTGLHADTPRLIAAPRGHCLLGPIEVTGARPGQLLAIRVRSCTPGPWGWTVAGARDIELTRALGVADGEAHLTVWDIDAAAGTATSDRGHRVRTAPFLGVTGLAPAEPGEHSTVPPRPGVGGNIDCRLLGAGATLLLPIAVPGALLYLGDGHARQGDGEVSGTAVETAMTTELTLDVVEPDAVDAVHATTPAGRVTFGFDADLNMASTTALSWMVTWMQSLLGLERRPALALASAVVDLRVTQIANDTWGVHAVLADDALTAADGTDLLPPAVVSTPS